MLVDSNLSGAKLWSSDMSVANLRGANLSGANLNHAKLRGADFSNVNLSDVRANNLKGCPTSLPVRWVCENSSLIQR